MPTYASQVEAGTTGVFEYTLDFPYAKAADIRVFIDGVQRDQGSGGWDYVFTTAGTKILFTTPREPQTGEILEIRRVTDISAANVTFAGGSGATQSDLNAAVKQLLYAVDELQEPAFKASYTLTDVRAADIAIRSGLDDTAFPTRQEIWLECTTTEENYGAGCWVNHDISKDPLTAYWRKLTNPTLYIVSASANPLSLRSLATGLQFALTSANWSVHFYGWR